MPEPGKLDLAFRSASRKTVEKSASGIADAAFSPEQGDAVVGRPDSGYYWRVDSLIAETTA
jgi:hypothetical protein